jgi:hypothetical protein
MYAGFMRPGLDYQTAHIRNKKMRSFMTTLLGAIR